MATNDEIYACYACLDRLIEDGIYMVFDRRDGESVIYKGYFSFNNYRKLMADFESQLKDIPRFYYFLNLNDDEIVYYLDEPIALAAFKFKMISKKKS